MKKTVTLASVIMTTFSVCALGSGFKETASGIAPLPLFILLVIVVIKGVRRSDKNKDSDDAE